MHIGLILAGRTIPGFNALVDSLAGTFRSPVSTKFIDFPFTRSFRKIRNQYVADVLLAELAPLAVSGDKTVFVVHEDLFCGSREFVFSHAKNGCAMVSATRLDPRFYGPPADLPSAGLLFRERIRKEVLRQIGRLCGLPDCRDKSCVMAPSDSVEGVDSKGKEFCAKCRDSLHLEG
jgi:archaemetzincin